MNLPRAKATRHFVGWHDAPVLRARDALAALAEPGPLLDLSGLLVVTPGGRAGRVMVALLADLAERTGRALSPPLIVTPGEIVESVHGPLGKPAGPLIRRLAWAAALRTTPNIESLVPVPPPDPAAWSAFGAMLADISDELAGEMLLFDDVPNRVQGWPRFEDHDRWACAAAVQQRYLEVLADSGLVDPAIAALLAAARSPDRPRPVCLVGVAELPAAARRALAACDSPINAIVLAPPEWRDHFDEIGCVRHEKWRDERVVIDDMRIHLADDYAGQADRAFSLLAESGEIPVHDIAVGVADEALVPAIEQRAERYGGLRVRSAGGRGLAGAGPALLLRALAEHLEHHSFKTFSCLVRHPDFERALDRRLGRGVVAQTLGAIDDFGARRLPRNIRASDFSDEATTALPELVREAESLLAPLRSNPLPLRAWAEQIERVLREVYAGETASRENPEQRGTILACERIGDCLAQLREGRVDRIAAEPVKGASVLRLLLDEVRDASAPDEPAADCIELLGWLELPLDPSPVVIVTGCNEGSLPSSVVAHALLPDCLRAELGIACDERRFARDIYLANLLVNSGRETHFIAGRRGKDGDPLTPSRLLLRDEPERVLQRVRRFTGLDRVPGPIVEVRPRLVPGERDAFPTFPLARLPRLEAIAVTGFRAFLACPYVFYVEHVLGLKEVEEPGPEMDARAFGNLVHDVLGVFGASGERSSADEGEIRTALSGILDDISRRCFGSRPLVSVRLQVEAARRRLEWLAPWQAQRRAEGWLIEHVEWKPREGGVRLTREGELSPFLVKGRIDRIERNERNGLFAILDYKTRERAPDPVRTHRNSAGEWLDLQLPLYRHLAKELGVGESPVLGYIALSAALEEKRLWQASWSEADLASADAAAWDVMKRIEAGEFADAGRSPPKEGPVAAMCGVGMVGERQAPGGEGRI